MALTQLAEDTSVCIHTTRSTSSQVHQSTGPSSAIETTVPVESYTHPSDLQRSSEEAEHVPPDGGVEAYLKVLGGFCVFFVTLGLASTFGSYQAYYESDLLKFSSPSTISWIGTSQVFLLSFIGTFSGAFYDWGYVQLVLGVGLSLIVFGLMMLSLAQEYWQILLSQGICVGIGQSHERFFCESADKMIQEVAWYTFLPCQSSQTNSPPGVRWLSVSPLLALLLEGSFYPSCFASYYLFLAGVGRIASLHSSFLHWD